MLNEDKRSRRPRRLAPIAAICAAGILAAACQSSGGGSNGGTNGGTGTSTPPADTVQLSITPASGSTGANPSKGITVTASNGTIKSVTVTGDGLTGQRAVTGIAEQREDRLAHHVGAAR